MYILLLLLYAILIQINYHIKWYLYDKLELNAIAVDEKRQNINSKLPVKRILFNHEEIVYYQTSASPFKLQRRQLIG